ncbi:MAG TPA: hypothetical protein VFE58_07925 [Tepidisphaeraceae bacterium]|jgi:hypothetical protein|nr:hypothetical protein [Tepidisphaeraceae bacterium]
MKKIIAAGALLTCVQMASAAALLYEPFNYTTPSTLNGQVGPTTGVWSVASTNTTAPPINVVASSLSGPTQLPASSGNMIQWGAIGSATNGAVDRLAFPRQTSGTVYWSMLFRVDDLTGAVTGTTGAFVAGFNNTPGSQTSGVITVAGARLVIRKDSTNSAQYDFGTSVNSNVGTGANPIQVFDTTGRDVGVTHFLVGSYTYNTGSATDDVAQLWIDPDPSTFGTDTIPAPSLTSTGADMNGAAGIATFFLRSNTSAPKQMSADELRVATTWNEVTSTLSSTALPEPTSGLLLIGGIARLMTRKQRRA